MKRMTMKFFFYYLPWIMCFVGLNGLASHFLPWYDNIGFTGIRVSIGLIIMALCIWRFGAQYLEKQAAVNRPVSLKNKNYGGSLSDDEIIWLNRSANRLSNEKSQRSYPRWTWLLTQGLLPVGIGMVSTFGVIFLALKTLNSKIDEEALTWSRMDIGVSGVLAVFLGVFLAAIAMILLAKQSTTVRDYLTYYYGWGYMSPRQRGEEDIKAELAHQLQQGLVSSKTSYDSDLFSDLIFHRTSPIWKKGTIGLFILTILFFILDSRSHYTIYPDRIEASAYFSLKTKTYKFQEISSVNRLCILAVNKKNPYSRFEYIIQMKDRVKVDLLSEYGPDENQQFSAIEAITPMIDLSSFNQTKVRSAPILKFAPTLDNCTTLLKRNKRPAEVIRIARIFDLPFDE